MIILDFCLKNKELSDCMMSCTLTDNIYMFNTPILFLIFARPDTTQKVFARIKQIQPKRLYVAADAPRKNRPDEVRRSEEARRIIEQIDWSCELYTLFRGENLGCKEAVSSAITWFFEQEEYGIILEDDCLPDLSFFPYCEELLVKYKDDDRVGHISGQCFFSDTLNFPYSYDYSKVVHIWGWASWRRVWKNFDINLLYWKTAKNDKVKRESLFLNKQEEIYFSSFISDTLAGNKGISAWDVQYLFMLRTQNQLSIYPSVNLVTNIGLDDPNATHTKKRSNKNHTVSEKMPFPLRHPDYMLSNSLIDTITIRKKFFSYKRLIRYLLGNY